MARCAELYGVAEFVETGTFRGDTVARLCGVVDRVTSIELSPDLYAHARRRFARYPSVDIRLGDSAVELPRVVQSLTRPALFWLDGHYSGGSTALSDVPILAELAAVLSAPTDHVVLIDDARLFDGTDGYPRLVDVLDDVRTRWPNCTVEVINDMVRIHR